MPALNIFIQILIQGYPYHYSDKIINYFIRVYTYSILPVAEKQFGNTVHCYEFLY